MQLKELAALMPFSYIVGDEHTVISGMQLDSRKLQPGDLFFCLPGTQQDGHDYALEAVRNGAAALVVEREVDVDIPQLIVKDSRRAMAFIACHYYQYPSNEMKLIGVTGTNGKTTTSYLIEKILADQRFHTGLMGNNGIKIGLNNFPIAQNGPGNMQESVDLQRTFRQMRNEGAEYCVIEVSSMGLYMKRANGIQFRTAVFTNLTQDHLDDHHTMENYRAAKGLLFSRLGNAYYADPSTKQFAVLNADDGAIDYFRSLTTAHLITYGIDRVADVQASNIVLSSQGTSFQVSTRQETVSVQLKMVGKFNVYNALAAIATTLAEGVSLQQIKNSLEEVEGVAGRVEIIDEGQDFLVLVDYAHTPDGLDNVLSTIREFAERRIICVFGCGGDRDRTKRPLMGGIAAQYCDFLLVTSDNPRTEDPEQILLDIEVGIRNAQYDQGQVELIVDRRTAISKAVEMAGPKDVILIAGKGHEAYQAIHGVNHYFDDRIEAKKAIRGKLK